MNNKFASFFLEDSFFRSHTIKELFFSFSLFSKEALQNLQKLVRVSGRLATIRKHSNFLFVDLIDQTGVIQLKIDSILRENFLQKLNSGCIIGIEGLLCKTEKEVLSLEVKNFLLLSKSFNSIPKVYYGLNKTEERFRKRYLDFIVNFKSRDNLLLRSRVIKTIRDYLDEEGFLEFETPILVSSSSGAQARPFVTFHNKLNKNFYLRIATEIHLKQLLIGGFEKVYEIGRIFRNEGVDARHNPEFTTIEIYQSYINYQEVMSFTENLFHFLANKFLDPKKIKALCFNSNLINLSFPFKVLTMTQAVKEVTGLDFETLSLEGSLLEAERRGIFLKPFQKTVGHILFVFFSHFVEKNLIQPTFIIEFPLEVSPLAKKKKIV